jgi:hypothetical protein
MRTTQLNHSEFIEIRDGEYVYFGGDQNWFKSNTIGVSGGCGTVAAANLLAYLAMSDSRLRNLYGYGIEHISVGEFTKHMNEVYEYVTPIKIAEPLVGLGIGKYGIPVTLGVPTLGMLANGIKGFAEDRGINILAHSALRLSNRERAVECIRDGLDSDSPVLLLIYINSDLKRVEYMDFTGKERIGNFQRHWVTITAIHENQSSGNATIDVSSWGSKVTLDLGNVMSFSGFGGMMHCSPLR